MTPPFLIVFAKEVRDNLRDRRSLISALVYPLLGPLVFAALLHAVGNVVDVRTSVRIPLPVAGAAAAPGLVTFLEANGLHVVPPPGDFEGAVRDGRVPAILIVPPDFETDLAAGGRPNLRLLSDASRLQGEVFAASVAEKLHAYGRQRAVERLSARGIDPGEAEAVTIENIVLEVRRKVADLFLFLVPPFIMFTVFIGGVYMAIDTTSGERERGSLEPLMANPVSRWQIMFGKYLAACVFTATSVALQLVAFVVVFRSHDSEMFTYGTPLGLAQSAKLVFLILPLMALAVGMQIIIAALTRSFKEAQTWLGLFPLVPAIPGMIMVFLPVAGATWMMGVPVFAQTVLMAEVMRGQEIPGLHLLFSTVVTLLAAAGMLRWAAHLFEREELIFGGHKVAGFPVEQFIAHYGYWAVFLLVGLENAGLPLPGEAVLVTAAVLAGTVHCLDIVLVILAAAGGGVMGANLGYWIGREFGFHLLLKHGSRIGIKERQLKLGQFLFLRHGGKVVFLGRLVAVLRVLAAFLAGINRMPWSRFLLSNIGGGILWAALFGVGGYTLGCKIKQITGPAGFAALAAGVVFLVLGVRYIRHHQRALEDAAERALPGPLDHHDGA